jgi:general secretion pathway protein C
MSVDRSIISRFAMTQSSADWENAFAKISLGRWQFVVRLLLVISLSFSLARLFWLLLPQPAIPPAAVAIPTVTNHAGGDGKLVDIAQLKALHVFGKAAEAPKQDNAAPAVIENQAVDTHLNLVLLGIVGSSDEKLARAIISTGDKQDVYSVGATLPVGNGVTLSKVLDDRVIINNNGQYESLWLYQTDPNAPSISRPVSAAPPPSPATQSLPLGRPGPMGPQMQSPAGESPEQAGDPGMAAAACRTWWP